MVRCVLRRLVGFAIFGLGVTGLFGWFTCRLWLGCLGICCGCCLVGAATQDLGGLWVLFGGFWML